MEELIKIKLIQETITTGDIGQEIFGTPTETTVWARRSSVTVQEWTSAGERGVNPEMRVEVYGFEYSGQTIVKIGSENYGVYRTYSKPGSEKIELYLEKKGGVSL